MTAATPTERERLLTRIFHASPVTTWAERAAGALWDRAERARPRWSRVLVAAADRCDDLGSWANRRRAARRLARKGRA